jgi:hypothetical protein
MQRDRQTLCFHFMHFVLKTVEDGVDEGAIRVLHGLLHCYSLCTKWILQYSPQSELFEGKVIPVRGS